MSPEEKNAHWEGYKLGILHASEFVSRDHGEENIGAWIITNLLNGVNPIHLRTLAKRENVEIDWRKVDHERKRAA